MNTQIFLSILEEMSWILIWPLMYLIISFIHHKKRNREGTRGKSALEIIQERYAKEEIDKKTFDEMRRDI